MASRGFDSFQTKSGTEEEWLKYDPVLRYGEEAYVSDKRSSKHGDGVHKFSELAYDSNSDLETRIAELERENAELKETIQLLKERSNSALYSIDIPSNTNDESS